MRALLLTAAALAAMATTAQAGAIESACNSSERRVSRALCGCIQQVADITLTRSDQRLAAKFFKDPQKAQDMRQSSDRSNESFWLKYKNFGATAEAYCSAG
jgi:hypothetical protein